MNLKKQNMQKIVESQINEVKNKRDVYLDILRKLISINAESDLIYLFFAQIAVFDNQIKEYTEWNNTLKK
jgi:hypothetical protein